MKFVHSYFLLCVLSFALFSQEGDSISPKPIIDFDIAYLFPEKAKLANISEANVLLKVFIDEKGVLKDVVVISSDKRGYNFEKSAVKVVKLAQWEPGIVKGKPIGMWHQVPVHFSLEDSEPPSILEEIKANLRKIFRILK
ncbi:energy transducer TonB [Leptospira sarikeiensis]|uniref:Energy transducer TonB n=1 Tax=Leptospira sarikeiensis TaxID=2484943 RepID=A0A4V3JS10_9LEPT|nr:energy transducer TonB [Leptospira sarikeiensis]TGL62839.1 energy transducer TonB [Leptospira sarikeiensis]